ncbi:MFS transporter [Mesorhizobium sp. CU2]|uniref:MFS transporter n=1 Tax=unclassified Mesorhizobium TaxID=325217 RepID=UPI001129DFD2|nr:MULTISPECIES: MFS transporter [unclassified Mesorhizobium]TPN83243.1 MFS transporter [Mesorhizobium sp. CU3]TPO15881.1 MFS transporter [Mesorhizobium sp. CU2]
MSISAKHSHQGWYPMTLLQAISVLSGTVIAVSMDAIASTALSIGRIGILGDIHATTDELATADIVFVAAKLVGFLTVPLFIAVLRPTACLRAGTVVLLLSCTAITLSTDLTWIYACRAFQGFAGSAILVAGQALLFFRFARDRQPSVQAMFAIGAVMAPTTLTPALQGWFVDHLSWNWIFLCNVPLGIAALVLLAADGDRPIGQRIELPLFRILLLGVAAAAITYVLQQGSRFNWLDDRLIAGLALLGSLAVGLFIVLEWGDANSSLIRLSLLRNPGFRFGLLASVVAGFALSGTSYLVPAFALNVLGMTATDAGTLLLPSGAMLGVAMLLAGVAIQVGLMPIAPVPLGIALFAGAMWMLSGATSASGPADLAFPLLLRGFGLGLLFISLTIIALPGLGNNSLPFGIGLFDFCKQLGGQLGTASLQTYIDHQSSLATTILSAHLVDGDPRLESRLGAVAASLAERGLAGGASSRIAIPLLQQMLGRQVGAIAFDEAFFALVLFSAGAAPALFLAKRLIGNQPPKETRP